MIMQSNIFFMFFRLHKSIIIGRDFMKKEKIQLDFGTDSITVQQDYGHVFSNALMPDRPAKLPQLRP